MANSEDVVGVLGVSANLGGTVVSDLDFGASPEASPFFAFD